MNGRLENELQLHESCLRLLKEMPDYATGWYNNMYAADLKGKTRYFFVCRLKFFLSTINENIMEVKPEDITDNSIDNYFISIKTKKDKNGKVETTSNSYITSNWCMMNNFIKYMINMGLMNHNHMLNIKKPSEAKDLKRIKENRIRFEEDDYKKILSLVGRRERDKRFVTRNKFMLSLLMITGVRSQALRSINLEDVDTETNTILVYEKGDIPRKLVLSESVMQLYYDYLADREKYANEDEEALFCSKVGSRITNYGITKIVNKYATPIMGKTVSPHKFRSAYITTLIEKTGSVKFAQEAVGHASMMTTQRYYASSGKESEVATGMMDDIIFGEGSDK